MKSSKTLAPGACNGEYCGFVMCEFQSKLVCLSKPMKMNENENDTHTHTHTSTHTHTFTYTHFLFLRCCFFLFLFLSFPNSKVSKCVCTSQRKWLTVICPFSVNYKSVMFYSTGPWSCRNWYFWSVRQVNSTINHFTIVTCNCDEIS